MVKQGTAAARSKARSTNRHSPKIVLCVGLKSSGSTWLYNVIAEILRTQRRAKKKAPHGRSGGVVQFYADNVDSFPEGAEGASILVVKAHIPSRSVQFLTSFAAAGVLLTVRDPRDAIASVMQRFGHPFDGALAEIAKGAALMVNFAKLYDPPIFQYERRFYDDPETVQEVARLLKVRLSPSESERIFAAYTREKVGRMIRRLEERGLFGPNADPDRFEPRSHWHPGHVGNLIIGKYREALSPKQQRATLSITKEFCRAFGYCL